MTDPGWSGYPPQYPSAPPTQPQAPASPSPRAPEWARDVRDAKAPGWYADPAGRHQFRYWDGAAWSDTVADRGSVGYEPVYGGFPTRAAKPKRRRTGLWVGLGVLVVLGLVAAGLLVFLGDGGDGSGTFARELESDGDTRVHAVQAETDTVVLIRVITSDDDFDPVIGVTTDAATVDEYADFFESDGALPDDDFPGALPNGAELFAVADSAAAGEDEVTFIATPFGGEFEVLVTGVDDSVGTYELEITIEDFDGPNDPQAYVEELANQPFVEDFAPSRSPIEDILDDFIDEGD